MAVRGRLRYEAPRQLAVGHPMIDELSAVVFPPSWPAFVACRSACKVVQHAPLEIRRHLGVLMHSLDS